MATATKTVRDLTWRSADLLRSFFQPHLSPAPIDPLHCDVPILRNAEIACVYYARRVAGDFYEFLRVSRSRMLFAFLDVAGRRADTRDVLIAAQRTFRTRAPKLFGRDDFNEAEAMIELCHEINVTILRFSGGVRSCPAFIGCYNENLGTICYANAGHTPGLLQDVVGITKLEATGLPLGLFSHVTHGASTRGLLPGAAFLIVSRGLLEVERGAEEFGLGGAIQSLQNARYSTAPELCIAMLDAAHRFADGAPSENDVTALALLRRPMRSTSEETATRR
jgi:serine phosphatase RsbU (regulator of sigma subunit)